MLYRRLFEPNTDHLHKKIRPDPRLYGENAKGAFPWPVTRMLAGEEIEEKENVSYSMRL